MVSIVIHAEDLSFLIDQAMVGLEVKTSDDLYSKPIKKKPVLAMMHMVNPRSVLLTARSNYSNPSPVWSSSIRTPRATSCTKPSFPIKKILTAKEQKQVIGLLRQFENVPFDPHAEKSAVDGLTGATRYGIKIAGHLNYMARRITIEMENQRIWSKTK